MALTAAELQAILTLDKTQFDRELSKAQTSAQKHGEGFKNWGTGVGKAVNDGMVLAATGAAGMAAMVTKVGVEYNTLQQTSRAALTTIMGGAEQANAQMDKLDDFASNSPFAKDVFIKAQQQLLGFGMEAENVVPTLDAIQNSVAAVGGSNEDIAEIANVLAKVEGTGKITAQTFNELGIRGIDAATIIGDEMGKTGAQIRDSVTEGTLDASEAVEALTTGMEKRFGGAAANVKDTYVGAMDRIKAATRDIGAEIARPFVDPNGGGRAVDWANDFADVLRAVEDQVPGVVSVLDTKLEPAFDRFRITMKDAVDTINGWDPSDFENILDRLGGHAPAIAGLSTAMFVMATSNIPVIGGLTSALGPLPAALGAAAMASPEMRDGLGDILSAGEPLIGVLGDLAGAASGTFTTALETTGDVLSVVADVIGPVVEWFSELPEPVRNAAIAAVIFGQTGGPVKTALGNMTTGVGNVLGQMGGWAGTFEGALDSTGDFRAAVGLAAGAVGDTASKGLRGAARGIMSLFGGPWGIALMGATALVTMWATEQREAKERAEELSSTLDEQTGAFTDATEAIVIKQLQEAITADKLDKLGESMETFGVSTADMTAAILDQGDAYDDIREAIYQKHLALEHSEEDAKHLMEISPVVEYIEEQIQAHELEAEAIRLATEAEKERNRQLDESERSHRRYVEAITDAVDETINMNDRVKALNEALDELNGVTKTQEERDRDLATTQRDLNGFFEDNAEAIEEMDESLVDLSTGMPSHTELGNDLNRMLQGMGDEAHEAALEIYDQAEAQDWSAARTQEAIAEAYEPYIATLQDLQEEGYLSQEEVDALTNSILGVPSITSYIITHNDSVTDTQKDVLGLVDQIESVPDGETYISDEGTSQDVIDELEDLGYEVKTLPDGKVEVKPVGFDAASEAVNEWINRPRNLNVGVTLNTSGARKGLQMLDTGQSSSAGSGIMAPRFFGGIDIFGMAAGGLTGASVMDLAQMVSPGDIRFAGDRSDVDEAWIPLDGSPRSISILEEAARRMPGYEPVEAEGMAAGGIDGTITPPEVTEVQAPDTAELEAVWQEAMAVLEDSTRDSFGTIEHDTAESQDKTTATTRAQLSMMRDITGEQLALMEADTTRHTTNMRDMSAAQFQAMQADGTDQTSALRDHTAASFLALQTDGTTQTSLLHTNTAARFRALHDDGTRETQGLRADSNREFTAMQTHGIDAAGRLRTGVVSEIGAARTPFAGGVNDLVEVMRDFSDAITKAYGDMGVEIGKPSRISAATGTILPGFNPGVDNHIFSSPTGGVLELSGGEGVSRPEVVQAMGPGAFNALNAAARTGGVAGVQRLLGANVPRQSFADGGIMDMFTEDAKHIGTEHKNLLPDNWLRPAGTSIIDTVVDGIGEALAAMFSGDGWVRPTTGRVTSPYGAGRGAYPHAGMDIAKGEGVPVVAPTAMRILETGWNIGPGRTGLGILGELMDGMWSYFGHNPVGGIRVKPGDLVAPGQQIGAQGNTGNSTGAHLHWEIHQGAPWRDINPHPFWDAAGGAPGAGGALPSGSNDMWTGIIMQALRFVGLPTTPAYVNAWLSQGKSESGLNPKAVQRVHDINSVMGNHARGIVQVIPPTFAAHSLPGMKNIFNPLHNFAAGMNYAKNRYGVTGMLGVIGKGHGYEHGTEHALPGWAWVGEAGPELVNFKGGERVLPHRESVAAVAGGSPEFDYDRMGKAVAKHLRPGATVNINHPTTRDTDELARKAAAAFHETLVSSSWGL